MKVSIQEALDEWSQKARRMGCVAASRWFCSKVDGFRPLRITRWTKDGECFEHVVCTDGKIIIDLTPYADMQIDLERG